MIAHSDLETSLPLPAGSRGADCGRRACRTGTEGGTRGWGREMRFPEAAPNKIGVKAQMLLASDLASRNLAQFDTIIVGIRASETRPDYTAHNSRLLDYVKNGGNLIVEYQSRGVRFDSVWSVPLQIRETA